MCTKIVIKYVFHNKCSELGNVEFYFSLLPASDQCIKEDQQISVDIRAVKSREKII